MKNLEAVVKGGGGTMNNRNSSTINTSFVLSISVSLYNGAGNNCAVESLVLGKFNQSLIVLQL